MKGDSYVSKTLLFDSVVVQDSNSKTPKEFRDVPIEVTGKEIYVGSNYKIKWKQTTSLRCKHNIHEPSDDEHGNSPRALQEYKDEDYEKAGFELTCTFEPKHKSKHLHAPSIERTVLVRFPIPPEGQRFVGSFWEAFRRALEEGYKKEVRKRQRKKDKEQALLEEERHEHEMRRKEFSKSRSRKTYSKRPYDFLRKNAANLAHNAEVWTDDEEEAVVEEPTPELVKEEAEDESENEFGDDFGSSTNDANDDVEDNSGQQSNQNEANDEDNDEANDEANGEDNDKEEDDDSVNNNVTTKSKKRRIKRRGPVLEDSEDEDDDLFQTNTAEMTAPVTTANRVVTPATGKPSTKVQLDNENGGEGAKEQEPVNDTDDEDHVQNNQKINSFFQPRSKPSIAAKDPNASKPKNSFFAPKPKAANLAPKTLTPKRTPKKLRKTSTATKAILDDDHSDSDESSTVAASETKTETANTPAKSPFLRAHSPKSKRSPFGIVRASESKAREERISIEDEDPIEEVESSQSQSPAKMLTSSLLKRRRLSGGRFTSSIKRRRLKMNSSKSALEALEYADARAPHLRSPVSVLRKTVVDSSTGASTGDRSPLQPLKLGPQVEMAASNNVAAAKWRGLRNDGNSCYVNSSLQQLFSVPTFMKALEGFREGHELTTKLSDLYANLNSKDKKSISASAKPFKRVVDKLTDRFHGFQQRDAHEFLGEVIDQIHEELSPPKAEGTEEETETTSPTCAVVPTDEFFRWNVQVCLKCKHCGYSRSKEEMYRYLSIDIGQDIADSGDAKSVKPAVDSCLANFFAPEDREVNCEKCEEGTVATQTMKILSVPKVVLLHLKRFMVVEKQGAEETTELVFKKNKVPVELTTDLSLGKLLSKNQFSSKLPMENYGLKSIAHHLGNTANSGHYTADAMRADPEDGGDRWVSFDDGIVAEKSLDKIVQSARNQRTAYMLLYSRD